MYAWSMAKSAVKRMLYLATMGDGKQIAFCTLGADEHVPSVHEELHVRTRITKDVQLLLTVHTH